jgi:hypothetical protein
VQAHTSCDLGGRIRLGAAWSTQPAATVSAMLDEDDQNSTHDEVVPGG